MTPYINDENFETVSFKDIPVGDVFWCEGSFYIRILNSDFCKEENPHTVYRMYNAFNVSDLKFEEIPWYIKVLACRHLTENGTLLNGISLESPEEFESKIHTERND